MLDAKYRMEHNLYFSQWDVSLRSIVNSRIKSSDAGIPLFQAEYEVNAIEHNWVMLCFACWDYMLNKECCISSTR